VTSGYTTVTAVLGARPLELACDYSPLQAAPLPPTVWNIPVACLLANAMRAPGCFSPKGRPVRIPPCARCDELGWIVVHYMLGSPVNMCRACFDAARVHYPEAPQLDRTWD